MIITFDDEGTSLDIIIGELKKGRFLVRDEPKYLKKGMSEASRQDEYCVFNGNTVMVKTEAECGTKGGFWTKRGKSVLPPVSLEVKEEELRENNARNGNTESFFDLFGNDAMYR